MKIYKIGSEILSIDSIREIIKNDLKLSLSSKVKKQIRECRKYLDKKIHESNDPIYGINTGFGSLYDKKVDKANLGELQKNLVLSHACGVGDEVPLEIVRLILLLKIQSLSYGRSGVQLVTVERLVDMYNNRILPIIYQQGSLGAS
ncbi:MAG: histidine ammonia-lyase, partial [Flavobacteriales bacterium]